MWYFAYGSNLNPAGVAQWCRHYGHRSPISKPGRPAVLDNYRLCFPVYSEYWGGGVADIVYDPGKYVAGGIFNLSETELAILDEKVGRKLDASGAETGIYKRITVTVAPLGKFEPVQAITYTGVNVDKYHMPPTRQYMDLLLQGAYATGLSMMWIAYLQSFSTQPGRQPRRPGGGNAGAKS
jgi:hypothetical protein